MYSVYYNVKDEPSLEQFLNILLSCEISCTLLLFSSYYLQGVFAMNRRFIDSCTAEHYSWWQNQPSQPLHAPQTFSHVPVTKKVCGGVCMCLRETFI